LAVGLDDLLIEAFGLAQVAGVVAEPALLEGFRYGGHERTSTTFLVGKPMFGKRKKTLDGRAGRGRSSANNRMINVQIVPSDSKPDGLGWCEVAFIPKGSGCRHEWAQVRLFPFLPSKNELRPVFFSGAQAQRTTFPFGWTYLDRKPSGPVVRTT
jgi:hypothetical protein